MIDFRYHLVSLVSVFLALAVGIVLGAGPLQGQITSGLTQRVNQLSDDRTSLTNELRAAKAGSDNRDTFTKQVAPSLVARQLESRSVVVLTLPGADDGTARSMIDTLQRAGATVTGRIDIKDAWVAPDKASARAALARQWRAALDGSGESVPSPTATQSTAPTQTTAPTPGPSGASRAAAAVATGTVGTARAAGTGSAQAAASRSASVPPSPTPSPTVSPGAEDLLLEAVLARAVVTSGPAQPGRDDAASRGILDALAKEGLLALNGDFTGRAGEAVVVAPGVEQATVVGAQQTASVSPSPDLTPTWTAMSVALDSASGGAVVVGPGSSAAKGGVLAALRSAGDLTRNVSTVDTGGTPMGDVTTVLALREQLEGAAGAYGFGPAATAPLPGGAS